MQLRAEPVRSLLAFWCLLSTPQVLFSEMTPEEFEQYAIRWNTESSFDKVPFADKLQYVFQSVSTAYSHPELSSNDRDLSMEDMAIMHEAFMLNPSPDRTLQLFNDSCSWYEEEKRRGANPDLDYMIEVVVTGERYELEDREAPYLIGFEMLSPRAKEIVLAEIETLRGKRVMSHVHTDYARLWQDFPDRATRFFERMCSRISEQIEQLDNWPKYKTIEWDLEEAPSSE